MKMSRIICYIAKVETELGYFMVNAFVHIVLKMSEAIAWAKEIIPIKNPYLFTLNS